MRFLAILALCTPLAAQSFQIVPSTAPHGGSGSLLVTLTSPAGKEPVALEWKIALGTGVTAELADIVAGAVATAAGKAIHCALASKEAPDNATYKCLLVGGVKNISNGTIFLVKYRIKPATTPQTLTVHISGGLAAWQQGNDVKQITMPPVEGSITVR